MTIPASAEPSEYYTRSGHVVLGVMVRTLGSFPSGWRHHL